MKLRKWKDIKHKAEEKDPGYYLTPTPEELEQHHKDRWAELDPKLQQKAVAYLKDKLPEGFLEEVKTAHETYGNEWVWEIGKEEEPFYVFHFMAGMGVRNLLRDVIKDEELPSGNWDNYYVEALERAAEV